MTDDGSLYSGDEADAPDDVVRNDADRRSLVTVLAIAVVIFIVVLILLMARGCGSVLNTTNRRDSTNQIVPAPGRTPVDGAISVWVAAGTDLQGALSAASINHTGIVDMGGGRFVIKVPVDTEVDAARRLRDIDGVYDAGRVYEDDTKTP
jgi:uncharacterized protein YceK